MDSPACVERFIVKGKFHSEQCHVALDIFAKIGPHVPASMVIVAFGKHIEYCRQIESHILVLDSIGASDNPSTLERMFDVHGESRSQPLLSKHERSNEMYAALGPCRTRPFSKNAPKRRSSPNIVHLSGAGRQMSAGSCTSIPAPKRSPSSADRGRRIATPEIVASMKKQALPRRPHNTNSSPKLLQNLALPTKSMPNSDSRMTDTDCTATGPSDFLSKPLMSSLENADHIQWTNNSPTIGHHEDDLNRDSSQQVPVTADRNTENVWRISEQEGIIHLDTIANSQMCHRTTILVHVKITVKMNIEDGQLRFNSGVLNSARHPTSFEFDFGEIKLGCGVVDPRIVIPDDLELDRGNHHVFGKSFMSSVAITIHGMVQEPANGVLDLSRYPGMANPLRLDAEEDNSSEKSHVTSCKSILSELSSMMLVQDPKNDSLKVVDDSEASQSKAALVVDSKSSDASDQHVVSDMANTSVPSNVLARDCPTPPETISSPTCSEQQSSKATSNLCDAQSDTEDALPLRPVLLSERPVVYLSDDNIHSPRPLLSFEIGSIQPASVPVTVLSEIIEDKVLQMKNESDVPTDSQSSRSWGETLAMRSEGNGPIEAQSAHNQALPELPCTSEALHNSCNCASTSLTESPAPNASLTAVSKADVIIAGARNINKDIQEQESHIAEYDLLTSKTSVSDIVHDVTRESSTTSSKAEIDTLHTTSSERNQEPAGAFLSEMHDTKKVVSHSSSEDAQHVLNDRPQDVTPPSPSHHILADVRTFDDVGDVILETSQPADVNIEKPANSLLLVKQVGNLRPKSKSPRTSMNAERNPFSDIAGRSAEQVSSRRSMADLHTDHQRQCGLNSNMNRSWSTTDLFRVPTPGPMPHFNSLVKVDFTPAIRNNWPIMTCFFVLTFTADYPSAVLDNMMTIEIRGPRHTTIILARVDDEQVRWKLMRTKYLDSGEQSQVVQIPNPGFSAGQAFCLVTNCILDHSALPISITVPTIHISGKSPETDHILLVKIRYPLFVKLNLDDLYGWLHIQNHSDRWKFERLPAGNLTLKPLMVTLATLEQIPTRLDLPALGCPCVLNLSLKISSVTLQDMMVNLNIELSARVARTNKTLETDPLLRLGVPGFAGLDMINLQGSSTICYAGFEEELVVMDNAASNVMQYVDVLLHIQLQFQFAAIGASHAKHTQLHFALPSILDHNVHQYEVTIARETGLLTQLTESRSAHIDTELMASGRSFALENVISKTNPHCSCLIGPMNGNSSKSHRPDQEAQNPFSDSVTEDSAEDASKVSIICHLRAFSLFALLIALAFAMYFVDTQNSMKGLYETSILLHDKTERLSTIHENIDQWREHVSATVRSLESNTKLMHEVVQEVLAEVKVSVQNDLLMHTTSTLNDAAELCQQNEIRSSEASARESSLARFEIDPQEKEAFKTFLHSWY